MIFCWSIDKVLSIRSATLRGQELDGLCQSIRYANTSNVLYILLSASVAIVEEATILAFNMRFNIGSFVMKR